MVMIFRPSTRAFGILFALIALIAIHSVDCLENDKGSYSLFQRQKQRNLQKRKAFDSRLRSNQYDDARLKQEWWNRLVALKQGYFQSSTIAPIDTSPTVPSTIPSIPSTIPSIPSTTDTLNPTNTGTGPSTSEPGTTEPGTTEPGPTEPGTTEPGTTEPGTTEPGPTEPGPTEPGTTEPGPTEPGTTEPGPSEPGPAEPEPTEPGPVEPEPTDPDPSPGEVTTSEEPNPPPPPEVDPRNDREHYKKTEDNGEDDDWQDEIQYNRRIRPNKRFFKSRIVRVYERKQHSNEQEGFNTVQASRRRLNHRLSSPNQRRGYGQRLILKKRPLNQNELWISNGRNYNDEEREKRPFIKRRRGYRHHVPKGSFRQLQRLQNQRLRRKNVRNRRRFSKSTRQGFIRNRKTGRLSQQSNRRLRRKLRQTQMKLLRAQRMLQQRRLGPLRKHQRLRRRELRRINRAENILQDYLT